MASFQWACFNYRCTQVQRLLANDHVGKARRIWENNDQLQSCDDDIEPFCTLQTSQHAMTICLNKHIEGPGKLVTKSIIHYLFIQSFVPQALPHPISWCNYFSLVFSDKTLFFCREEAKKYNRQDGKNIENLNVQARSPIDKLYVRNI